MRPVDRDDLPANVVRVVRLAPVPMYLRAIFSRLPEPLLLDADIGGDPGALPLAARQLLKLGLYSEQLTLGRVRVVDVKGVQLKVSRRGRVWSPTNAELDRGISWVAQHLLEVLLEREEASALLRAFAFQSSNLATLRTITTFMLQATDVDQALYVMLSGITSGYSLGFNRAALFTWDAQRGVFVGSKAIGPFDDDDAHHIWEAIEFEDKDIDALLGDVAQRNFDTRFQQRVQAVVLSPDEPEVARALGCGPPVLFRVTAPQSPGLSRLGVSGEFVLAALKPHGRTLGLILTDNRFSRAAVFPDQLEYLSFFTDQTALVWENLALLKREEELARVDGLTGVLNRRELDARLEAELRRCQRHDRPCSVVLVDVDYFKNINDTRGHAAGDDVLRGIGAMLRTVTRTGDVVGRFGGDEFVVVMPEAPREHLLPFVLRAGEAAAGLGVSLSLGGATAPLDGTSAASLLAAADQRLYQAKRAGRRGACVDDTGVVSFS